MQKHNEELTLCFVDFRKAFDSISRQAIFVILPLCGIPEPTVEAIKSLYINTEATVITPDGETEFFEITAGVLQGNTLAPFIFMIVLDYIVRLSLDNLNDRGLQIQPRHSRRHAAQHLADLDFADDLALITEQVEDAEALLQSLERAAALIGLYCNESKTEYINTTDSSHNLKSLSGGTIKRVQDFKYLGAWMMDSEKDFKVRKSLAWAACNKLKKLWHSDLPNEYKVFLFQHLVEPVLFYGAETWTLTQTTQKRLDGTYTNLLCRVQNIHWSEHATKERIYGNLAPSSDILMHRRHQFAGHCLRAESEIISSLLLWNQRLPIRNRMTTYPQTLSRDSGIEVGELGQAMRDRTRWHAVVADIPTSDAEG